MNLTLPDALYATLKARKVLVQLSGGKDSCSLVLLMKRAGVEIEAIHFFHEYAYSIPSEMAENICSRTGVNLVKMDITVELQDTLVRHSTDRPCRHCKAIMDRLTIEYASTHGFDCILVGDTGDDTALISRLES